MRPLSTPELVDIAESITQGYERIQGFQEKAAFMVLGTTGAGKSSLIRLLMGCQFEVVEDDHGEDELKEIHTPTDMLGELPVRKGPIAKNVGRSVTFLPEIYLSSTDLALMDTPGFDDTGTDTQKIATVIFRELAMNAVKNIQALVVLIDYEKEIKGRYNSLLRLVDSLKHYIPNTEEAYKAQHYVFVINKATGIPKRKILKKLAATLKDRKLELDELKEQISQQLKKSKTSRINIDDIKSAYQYTIDNLMHEISILEAMCHNPNHIILADFESDTFTKELQGKLSSMQASLTAESLTQEFLKQNKVYDSHSYSFKMKLVKFTSEFNADVEKLNTLSATIESWEKDLFNTERLLAKLKEQQAKPETEDLTQFKESLQSDKKTLADRMQAKESELAEIESKIAGINAELEKYDKDDVYPQALFERSVSVSSLGEKVALGFSLLLYGPVGWLGMIGMGIAGLAGAFSYESIKYERESMPYDTARIEYLKDGASKHVDIDVEQPEFKPPESAGLDKAFMLKDLTADPEHGAFSATAHYSIKRELSAKIVLYQSLRLRYQETITFLRQRKADLDAAKTRLVGEAGETEGSDKKTNGEIDELKEQIRGIDAMMQSKARDIKQSIANEIAENEKYAANLKVQLSDARRSREQLIDRLESEIHDVTTIEKLLQFLTDKIYWEDTDKAILKAFLQQYTTYLQLNPDTSVKLEIPAMPHLLVSTDGDSQSKADEGSSSVSARDSSQPDKEQTETVKTITCDYSDSTISITNEDFYPVCLPDCGCLFAQKSLKDYIAALKPEQLIGNKFKCPGKDCEAEYPSDVRYSVSHYVMKQIRLKRLQSSPFMASSSFFRASGDYSVYGLPELSAITANVGKEIKDLESRMQLLERKKSLIDAEIATRDTSSPISDEEGLSTSLAC